MQESYTIHFPLHSLFIKQNGDDYADDEDHGQDRSHHPDEAVSTRLHGLGVHVGGQDGVRVRAGHKRFLKNTPTFRISDLRLELILYSLSLCETLECWKILFGL